MFAAKFFLCTLSVHGDSEALHVQGSKLPRPQRVNQSVCLIKPPTTEETSLFLTLLRIATVSHINHGITLCITLTSWFEHDVIQLYRMKPNNTDKALW